jgi:hypothetical protein
VLWPGAVEKLLPAKFAKIKTRQDALQTTFSVFLDIFYPPILAVFRKMGFFNSHACLRQLSNLLPSPSFILPEKQSS